MRVFQEVQRFKNPIILVVLPAVQLLFGVGLFYQVILKQPFGENPVEDWILIAINAFIFLLIVLFLLSKLEVHMDQLGITYRFFPFQRKSTTIPWEEVLKPEVRTYSPIGEFGGWGLRGGKNNRCYTMYGTMGIDVLMKNGRRLLIGTQKAMDARKAVKELFYGEILS